MKPNTGPILAVDTSCDETSCAVVQGITVLSNVVASQVELHRPYGGVFPTVAKLAHAENIEKCVQRAVQKAGLTSSQLAACAVTIGPGLAPALEVGIRFIKQFATKHTLPLIPVNHMEGHLLSVLAKPNPRTKVPTAVPTRFPVLGVIISGGHSEFVRVTGFGEYTVIGRTLDDAAGECLDKVGRMLNLGYPAGPVIEAFAKVGNAHAYDFPLPLTQIKSYDLSFSGLKTYTRNRIEKMTNDHPLSKQMIYDLSASIQNAVFKHICYKLNYLLSQERYSEIWLSGGVAANMELRRMIRTVARAQKNYSPKVKVPFHKKLCGDNAAMIGVAAALNPQHIAYTDMAKFPDRQPRASL